MANPSTAHEPSMEDILASIRQIISEDGEGTGTGKTGPEPTQASSNQVEAVAESKKYESVVSRFDPAPEPTPMDQELVHHEPTRTRPFAPVAEAVEDFEDSAAHAASIQRHQLA